MTQPYEFAYDKKNDVVICTPHGCIAGEDDIRAWLKQFTSYLQPFGRKMDLIVVLDDFDVRAKVGAAWGRARAQMLCTFVRFHIRVRPPKNVRLFCLTGRVQHSANADQVSTVEEALALIHASRLAAASP